MESSRERAWSFSAGPSERAFLEATERFGHLLRALDETSHPDTGLRSIDSFWEHLTEELARWVPETVAKLATWPGWGGGPALGRAPQLISDWLSLQTRLAALWANASRSAAARFIERTRANGATPGPDQVRRIYDSWIECAEEAYRATANTEEYSRLQGELINTTNALIMEQRQNVERMAGTLGLSTQSELDLLRRELSQLRKDVRRTRQRRRRK